MQDIPAELLPKMVPDPRAAFALERVCRHFAAIMPGLVTFRLYMERIQYDMTSMCESAGVISDMPYNYNAPDCQIIAVGSMSVYAGLSIGESKYITDTTLFYYHYSIDGCRYSDGAYTCNSLNRFDLQPHWACWIYGRGFYVFSDYFTMLRKFMPHTRVHVYSISRPRRATFADIPDEIRRKFIECAKDSRGLALTCRDMYTLYSGTFEYHAYCGNPPLFYSEFPAKMYRFYSAEIWFAGGNVGCLAMCWRKSRMPASAFVARLLRVSHTNNIDTSEWLVKNFRRELAAAFIPNTGFEHVKKLLGVGVNQ